MVKFLKENLWCLIFVSLFIVLYLLRLFIPDIESISWLNKIITSPFILVSLAVILVGFWKTSIYIVSFFKCKHSFMALFIFFIVFISIEIALETILRGSL